MFVGLPSAYFQALGRLSELDDLERIIRSSFSGSLRSLCSTGAVLTWSLLSGRRTNGVAPVFDPVTGGKVKYLGDCCCPSLTLQFSACSGDLRTPRSLIGVVVTSSGVPARILGDLCSLPRPRVADEAADLTRVLSFPPSTCGDLFPLSTRGHSLVLR